jgi:hypothetical protein
VYMRVPPTLPSFSRSWAFSIGRLISIILLLRVMILR